MALNTSYQFYPCEELGCWCDVNPEIEKMFSFTFAELFPATSHFLTVQSILIFTSVLLATKTLQNNAQFPRLPPGPIGFPILGFLPFLAKNIHEQLAHLTTKYGSIFKLYFGRQLVVVLSDPKSIREAFRHEAFSGRPQSQFTKILDGYGIINTEGELWRDQRKFLYSKLRSFGQKTSVRAKEELERRIKSEVHELLRTLGRNSRQDTIDEVLGTAASNVISSLMMSIRFAPTNPQFKRFQFLMEEGFRLFGVAAQMNFFPILRFLPHISRAYYKIKENKEEMDNFFLEIIRKHRESFDPEVTRDVVDSYLLELHKAKEEGREGELFCGKDPERQLCQILGDLYSAGQETVKTTLQWGILYMLHHPDVADKVQQELDRVVGRERLPRAEDVRSLPYTEATICEVMRKSSVVGLGTIHSTQWDTELEGFYIPKDTNILPLIYNCHMSEEYWKKPHEFDPHHFIGEDGHILRPEAFIPFSVGRRMCLGNLMATMEIFLFFTSMMHCFSFSVPEGAPFPSLRAHVAATITPEKFKVNVVPRDDLFLRLPEMDHCDIPLRF